MGQVWLLRGTLADEAAAFFLKPDSGDSDFLTSASTG